MLASWSARPLGLRASSLLHTRPLLNHRSSQRPLSFDHVAVVDTLTESLQQLHVYSGLPWWACIPLATFGLRAVWTLPLAVVQRLRIQKQNRLRPIIAASSPILRLNLAKKASKAAKESSSSVLSIVSPLKKMRYEEIMVLSAKEVRKRQKKLFKAHGLQLYKNFFLPAAQIPLWVCMSLTFRNLSGWQTWDAVLNKALDPTLYTEGMLWFQDLTTADPNHIFPLAVGIVALVNAEWTFRTFELMKVTARKRVVRTTIMDSLANVSRMAVVFLMAISLHAPTALTFYWLSSQVFSLLQNVFLDLMIPINFTPKKRLDNKVQTNADALNVIRDRET